MIILRYSVDKSLQRIGRVRREIIHRGRTCREKTLRTKSEISPICTGMVGRKVKVCMHGKFSSIVEGKLAVCCWLQNFTRTFLRHRRSDNDWMSHRIYLRQVFISVKILPKKLKMHQNCTRNSLLIYLWWNAGPN